MFEQETDTIIASILQRVTVREETVAVKDILASDIPYCVKTFFRADVESMLLAELQSYHKSSRFDHGNPEVRSLQDQINSVLVLHHSFPREDFSRRLHDAVHLLVNYHVRPQWTLSGVLFERDPSISAQALLALLRYFSPYDYLREIIARYVREKGIASFAARDFTQLMWKADGEFIRRKTGTELARITTPLFEFLDYPKNTGCKALPIRSLVKFFEDKGLTSATSQLEGELLQGKTELRARELENILEDVRRTCGAFEVHKVDRDQPGLSMPSGGSVQEAPRSGAGTEPARLIEFTVEENDRRRFVKKIFLQDEEAFDAALRSLGARPSWKEASKFIDEIFIRNDINPYSSEAKRFIEVIFGQYHPKQ